MNRAWLVPLLILSPILLGNAAGPSVPASASERADPPTIEWRERQLPIKPERFERTESHEPNVVIVKFMDDADVSVQAGRLRAGSQLENDALVSIADLTREAEVRLALKQSPEKLREWRENAIRNLGRDVADLSKLVKITVPNENSALALVNRLNAMEIVELAGLAQLPEPPPNPPNLESNQGYLFSAPSGVSAEGVWDTYGATGAGVKLASVEWSYNDHVDIPSITDVNGNPTYQGEANHGTATFGIFGSSRNGEYTTGISYGSPLLFSTVWTGGEYICEAMGDAMVLMSPGDVIVLEAQYAGPNGTGAVHGYVPVEWDPEFYNCIETAIGNGYVIVMAAGNQGTSGVNYNLDASMFNTGHAPFLAQNDSGSIIVGAGYAPSTSARTHIQGSHGSRVNLQGWGNAVTTTEGTSSYTYSFGGTSSATAIVGAVAALVQSAYKSESGGIPATPAQMREALVATGTSQVVPPNNNIGPLPDALAAVEYLLVSLGSTPSVPPNFSVSSFQCYGQGQAQWGSSGSGVTYQLQASHSSSFSSPWFQYVGTSQSKMLNVSSPTYFRVRACSGSNCSAFSSYGLLSPISGCY